MTQSGGFLRLYAMVNCFEGVSPRTNFTLDVVLGMARRCCYGEGGAVGWEEGQGKKTLQRACALEKNCCLESTRRLRRVCEWAFRSMDSRNLHVWSSTC